jgi:hypothetical protein
VDTRETGLLKTLNTTCLHRKPEQLIGVNLTATRLSCRLIAFLFLVYLAKLSIAYVIKRRMIE